MPDDAVEVMLVEDNIEDVELTLHALRQRNLANKIVVARDGAEALDLLLPPITDQGVSAHATLPRVVLLDLKLPKVSGLEVLEKMRQDPRTRAIPVVVLTSSREDRDVEEAYRLGANSYIVKPVEFESFTRAIGELGLYWLVLNERPLNHHGGGVPPAGGGAAPAR